MQRMCIFVMLDVLEALQDAFAHDLDLLDVLFDLMHVIDNLGNALEYSC